MKRIVLTVGAAIVAAMLVTACQQAQSQRPQNDAEKATTQPGSAAAQSATDRAGSASGDCGDLPSADDLKTLVRQAPGDGGPIGGMFDGRMEWVSVVNRRGELCANAVATDDPASSWQGSAAIAKAKAYTANAFSTDTQPISTARLYTMAQPGHSLFGAAAANPFNPACLGTPKDAVDAGKGQVCGGTIVFGGGVPLYRGKTRVGGLGASGDTSCADHEIAKRMRHLAKLDPEQGEYIDDIVYTKADGPSVFAHPLCSNTWRNGKQIGDEQKPMDY
jgi:uncharacterized protein GlcG (DUF336 family)